MAFGRFALNTLTSLMKRIIYKIQCVRPYSSLLALMCLPAWSTATEIAEGVPVYIDRCAAIKASVIDAGFADKVNVSCDSKRANLSSDSFPDHELMTGIIATNEQVPVPVADYAALVPLQPVITATPKTRDAALAVAVNGVPIYDYTGGGEMSSADLHLHQHRHDTLQTRQLDKCGGHAGRGNDYHYHASPTCMIDEMINAGDDAIIGWAFDGFPLYANNNPDGTAVDDLDLDVCNGQLDDEFGYRYHTSKDAPYIIQCLMGKVENFRDLPRVLPLRHAEGSRRIEPGKRPTGGVENLSFTRSSNGVNSMDYSYDGEEFYIRYKPSDIPTCYDMETRTIADNGLVNAGVYCR